MPSAGLLVVLGVSVAALVGQQAFLLLAGDRPALQTWSTVFVARVLQAHEHHAHGGRAAALAADPIVGQRLRQTR